MAKRYSKNRRKSRKAIPLLLVLILASMLHTAIPKSVLYDLKAAVKSIMGSLDGSFQGISAQQDAPYEEVNGNVPCFADSDYTTECFYELSELDHLGRCGTAFACFGPETLAEGERGSIGHVRPSDGIQLSIMGSWTGTTFITAATCSCGPCPASMMMSGT